MKAAKVLKQQGWLPTKALQPVIRAFCPGLPNAGSPDAVAMHNRWLHRSGWWRFNSLGRPSGVCLHPDSPVHNDLPVLPEGGLCVPVTRRYPQVNTLVNAGASATVAWRDYMLHYISELYVLYMCVRATDGLVTSSGTLKPIMSKVRSRFFAISVGYCLQGGAGRLGRRS